MKTVTRLAGIPALVAGISVGAAAYAQGTPEGAAEGEATTVADIIVTAQRRSESLQETPLAVSALEANTLADKQVVDVRGLAQLTPSVVVGSSLGMARISVRGISYDTLTQAGEARVAYHVDGVYISRPPAQLATFFDVDRVEVLRGPQGTLYGRNATAGAINVITRDPSYAYEGYVRGTAGNFNLVRTEGAASIPLGEDSAMRFAFQTIDRDGYGENPYTGLQIDDQRTRAARAKLRFSPTANLKVVLSADYFTQNDHASPYIIAGGGHESPAIQPISVTYGGNAFAREPWDSGGEISQNEREIYGFAGMATWSVGDVQVDSITGYRHSDTRLKTELDGTPAHLTMVQVAEVSDHVSQELRAQGDSGWGHWLVGVYGFHEEISAFNALPYDRVAAGLPAQFSQGAYQGGSAETRAYAVFGQADIAVTEALTLTVGARYSTEKKSIDEQFQLDLNRAYSPTNPVIPMLSQVASKEFSSFTPRLGLSYEISPDVFTYLSYSKGFKSGAFNLGGVQPPLNPEKITAYEAGVRADWMSRRLRTNLTAYYYDYKDIQVTRLLNNVTRAENAAAAEIYGLEAEITAVPLENLQIDFNGSWSHSEFVEFLSADASRPSLGAMNLAGKTLPQSPPYSVGAGVQYSWPLTSGRLTARLDSNFVGKVYFSAFNREDVSQDAYSKFDALLKYETDSRWTLTAFMKNITNEATYAYSVVGIGLVGFPIVVSYDPPRVFGISAEFEF